MERVVLSLDLLQWFLWESFLLLCFLSGVKEVLWSELFDSWLVWSGFFGLFFLRSHLLKDVYSISGINDSCNEGALPLALQQCGEEGSVGDDTSRSLSFMRKEPENVRLWNETQELTSEKEICEVRCI